MRLLARLRTQRRDEALASSPPDEARLIEAAAKGDREAFATLYDQHMDRVFRHCYYRTGNPVDAEDLTQQTFLRAWQAMHRYRRTGAPFIAWLLTISDRLVISAQRKSREVTTGRVEVPGYARGPEEVIDTRLAHDAVRQAILHLRHERQQVVLLRFIEGFSVNEVAAALGKSPGNISVIQHRALADLRRLLAEPLSHPGHAESTVQIATVRPRRPESADHRLAIDHP